jgi:hypothetical protein
MTSPFHLFISYRREDSLHDVGRLHAELQSRLRSWKIFYDHYTIEPGQDFPARIRDSVTNARVVLVMIGPRWLQSLKDRQPNPGLDFVREEVRLALEAGNTVIPVLVSGALMPTETDLADFKDLLPLLRFNAMRVRAEPDFENDLDLLVDYLCRFSPASNLGMIGVAAVAILELAVIVFLIVHGNSSQATQIEYVDYSNDFLPRLPRMIEDAKHDVWFFGTDFHITAQDRKEQLLDALHHGVNIKFLVLDPDVPDALLTQMEHDFAQPKRTFIEECYIGLDAIFEIKDEWEKNPTTAATIDVRVYQHYPWTRVYFFDPNDDAASSIYFVPYISSANTPKTPGFFFKNGLNVVAKTYHNTFLNIWTNSKQAKRPPR